MSTPPPRVVLYCRLSRTDDDSTSIERQESDLLALAEREGWTVVATLSDEGISGAVNRANAEEALAMLRDGRADVLAVWKLDRWSRQGLGAVASLIDALESRPGLLFVALQDGLRSSQPAWRIIASVLSEVAYMEREAMRTRQLSAKTHGRRTGRFRGGRPPYGYTTAPHPSGSGKTLVLAPDEVAVVREVADRLISGESLLSITRDLNERGVPTRTGTAWRPTTLHNLLRAPAIVGRVVHSSPVTPDNTKRRVRTSVVRGDDGLPLQPFPSALPLETWDRVTAILSSRDYAPRVKRARLLSGVALCALCKRPLYVSKGSSHGRPTMLYRCQTRSLGHDCPSSLSIQAETLEEFVTERFLSALGDLPEVRQETTTTRADAELSEVDRALHDLATELAEALTDEAAETITVQMSTLRRERQRLTALPARTSTRWVPTGRTYADAWTASDVDVRRRLLTSWTSAVYVHPGRGALDDRVRFGFMRALPVVPDDDATPPRPGVTVVVPREEYTD